MVLKRTWEEKGDERERDIDGGKEGGGGLVELYEDVLGLIITVLIITNALWEKPMVD